MKKIAYLLMAVVFLSVIGLPSAHADLYVSSSDDTIYRFSKNASNEYERYVVISKLAINPDPGYPYLVDSSLDDPRRLVINPADGDIYVVNWGDNTVRHYSYNGTEYDIANPPLISPPTSTESLALGPDPDNPTITKLYVLNDLEDGTGAVYKCDLDLNNCASYAYGEELNGIPADMVFGPDFDDDGTKDIYITNPDKNKIVVIKSGSGPPREIVTLIPSAGTNVSAIDFGDYNNDGTPDLYVYRNPSIGNLLEKSERVDVYNGETWEKITLIDLIRVGDFVIHKEYIDNNTFDECGLETKTWYLDGDGDGFGSNDPEHEIKTCIMPDGYEDNNDDCDDAEAAVNPDADDTDCDGVDEDCDGTADDDYASTPTACGQGECLGNSGNLECQSGDLVNTCDPLAGAVADENCNGSG